MSSSASQKVALLKEKIKGVEKDIAEMEKTDKSGGLSPIEKMRLKSLHEAKKDYIMKLNVYSS